MNPILFISIIKQENKKYEVFKYLINTYFKGKHNVKYSWDKYNNGNHLNLRQFAEQQKNDNILKVYLNYYELAHQEENIKQVTKNKNIQNLNESFNPRRIKEREDSENRILSARRHSNSVQRINPKKYVDKALNNDDPTPLKSIEPIHLAAIYTNDKNGEKYTVFQAAKKEKKNHVIKWIISNHLLTILEEDKAYAKIKTVSNSMYLRSKDFDDLSKYFIKQINEEKDIKKVEKILSDFQNKHESLGLQMNILPIVCYKRHELIQYFSIEFFQKYISQLDVRDKHYPSYVRIIYDSVFEYPKNEFLDILIHEKVYSEPKPLTLAIQSKKPYVVRYLINNDHYKLESFDQSPFIFACCVGDPSILECFENELNNPAELSKGFSFCKQKNIIDNEKFIISKAINLIQIMKVNINSFSDDLFENALNKIDKKYFSNLLHIYSKLSIEKQNIFIKHYKENNEIEPSTTQNMLKQRKEPDKFPQSSINFNKEADQPIISSNIHTPSSLKSCKLMIYDAIKKHDQEIISICISHYPEVLLQKITKKFKPIELTIRLAQIKSLNYIIISIKKQKLLEKPEYFQLITEGYEYSRSFEDSYTSQERKNITKILKLAINKYPSHCLDTDKEIHKNKMHQESFEDAFRMSIIEENTIKIIQMYNEDPECINHMFVDGLTPLFLAIINKKVKAIKILLEKGADILQKSIYNKIEMYPYELVKSLKYEEGLKLIYPCLIKKAKQFIDEKSPQLKILLRMSSRLYKMSIDESGIMIIQYAILKNDKDVLGYFLIQLMSQNTSFILELDKFAKKNNCYSSREFLQTYFQFLKHEKEEKRYHYSYK